MLDRVIMMGSDFYELPKATEEQRSRGVPGLGVGRNTTIENAIIDKNARVGDNCVLSPAGKPKDFDHELYYIRDSIVVIPKNGIVPDGTKI
jgi:glucose-1-phosphate adenylyltransferase